MASTEERVRTIVIDRLGVDTDRVTPSARFREDLEADSLDLVELIMAFEEEFGGEISDEDAQKITTVGEAIQYIDQHMSSS
jgi:acyl carrier protein